MKRLTSRWALGFAVLAMVCASAATAEVTISITITGTIDELLPILKELQAMGVGAGSDADPLKLRVHSVMNPQEGGPATTPPPAPETPPPPPKLGFVGAAAQPATAKAGETVLFTAKVSDPNHVVDTVALTVGDVKFDLFDNGANGDATAMDGVWSRNYELPASLGAGAHIASIAAFDVNGEPVKVTEEGKGEVPMTTEVPFTMTE